MDLDFGTILACAITVCGSIGGSWVAMNNRLYTVEKNIELLKLDLENYKKSNDKRSDDLAKSLETITEMFKEVMDSIRDINFKLKLKQDRKFKEEQ